MKVKELLYMLDVNFPLSLAAEWDNSGLQAGNLEDEVRGIFVALDATTENIGLCIQGKCNVLLTHHPLIFSPIKQVTSDDFVGRRLMGLISNGISCISMHTNFDVAAMGPLVAEKFPYAAVESLDDDGIGTIGQLTIPMKLQSLALHTKEAFRLPSVNFYGNPSLDINTLAIVPGSGHDDIDIARRKGADVLITGDVSHHAGLDALEKGLCIIDAGHYGLESIFVEYMVGRLKDTIPGIFITRASSKFPYHTV